MKRFNQREEVEEGEDLDNCVLEVKKRGREGLLNQCFGFLRELLSCNNHANERIFYLCSQTQPHRVINMSGLRYSPD